MYNIHNYKLLTASCKNKSGGGVGMYIKDGINFRLREDLFAFHETRSSAIKGQAPPSFQTFAGAVQSCQVVDTSVL